MSRLDQTQELEAFFHLFAVFSLSRPTSSIEDLADGIIFSEILSLADSSYFHGSAHPTDNWVIRFNALKRLYRLMTQYLAAVLHKPTNSLEVPDLQALAQDFDITPALIMCRLTIAIGVHSSRNTEFVGKIQKLTETDQHRLMRALERVEIMANIGGNEDVSFEESGNAEDNHYYHLQSEKSLLMNEKDTLQKSYDALLENFHGLQSSLEDAVSEKDEALARLRAADRHADYQRNDKTDAIMRAEIDRLRTDLQKSEDNLAVAEQELDRKSTSIADLTRQIEDMQVLAESAEKLKDQVDEYKHVAERLQKNENVMEKYKKKLQEGAELRQTVKTLEKQNADLINKNAAVEEEYRKVSAFKPLMESYKNQIAELESKNSARTQELDSVRFELDQTRTRLKIVTEQRSKDSETLELYQERVRELELTTHNRPAVQTKHVDNPDTFAEAESLGNEDGESEDDVTQGLGGELDDAISGTTMTDLKLQIRKLKRELEAFQRNEANAGRILVLENLLEDANRMKNRYESDYLATHREKLVLQRDLEEIRSGRSMGDGAEAAIALRQRLDETLDHLDELRKKYAELEVNADTQTKELLIAKADLSLVNRDQLDILSTLRESVNEDKAGMEVDMTKLREQVKDLSERNRMQLEQINGLLLEKIGLQTEGIGHREQMLQRERDLGDLRASISGRDLPQDVKSRLLSLHEENLSLKESQKTLQGQLMKARVFIKDQDKLFQEQYNDGAANPATPEVKRHPSGTNPREGIPTNTQNMMQQYRYEQEIILGLLTSTGIMRAQSLLGSQTLNHPKSWLRSERWGNMSSALGQG